MPPVLLFSALADETRCTIIEMLRVEPLPVHRLAEAFAISRPAISRHLRVLSEAGLVSERKQGRENIYGLRTDALEPGAAWLAQLSPPTPSTVRPVATKARAIKPIQVKAPKPEPQPVQFAQMEFDL